MKPKPDALKLIEAAASNTTQSPHDIHRTIGTHLGLTLERVKQIVEAVRG